MHAIDAPRPISTGKLLHLEEIHRINACRKKEATQKNVQIMQWRAASSTCYKTVLDVFVHKEIIILGVSTVTRNVKAFPCLLEQQSISTRAVAGTHATTPVSNLTTIARSSIYSSTDQAEGYWTAEATKCTCSIHHENGGASDFTYQICFQLRWSSSFPSSNTE